MEISKLRAIRLVWDFIPMCKRRVSLCGQQLPTLKSIWIKDTDASTRYMLIDFSLLVSQQQLTWISETLHSYPSLFLWDSLRLVAALRKNLSFKWQIQWSDYEWNGQKFTGMQRSLMSSPVIKGHFERGSSLHKGCSQAGQLRGRRPNRLPALGSKWTLVRRYLGIIRIQWTNKQSIHAFSQFCRSFHCTIVTWKSRFSIQWFPK